MAKRNLTIIIGNSIMKLLLRSPWHRVASQEIMLITVTGRKSGKRYTTPVNYVEDEESGILTVLTHQHRTWWRNLGDGAPVTVLVRGKTLTGTGYAYTAGSDLAERFFYYLSAHPKLAQHFDVGLHPNGQPIRAAAEKAAPGKVMVEVWLDGDYAEVDEDEATDLDRIPKP